MSVLKTDQRVSYAYTFLILHPSANISRTEAVIIMFTYRRFDSVMQPVPFLQCILGPTILIAVRILRKMHAAARLPWNTAAHRFNSLRPSLTGELQAVGGRDISSKGKAPLDASRIKNASLTLQEKLT